MKIAFNTLSENPIKRGGSFDYFLEMSKLLPLIDRKNTYYFMVSRNNEKYFINTNNIISGYSNEKKIKRILSEHLILPNSLLRNEIDVFFTSSSGGIAPLFLPRKLKLVLGVFGTHHLKANLLDYKRNIYRNLLFKKSLSRANIITVNSNYCKNDIMQTGYVKENKIRTIYHGIDNDKFNNNSLSKNEIDFINKFNISAPYILFVSVIYPYKNVHTLVEAFGKFIHKYKSSHSLVLIGRFVKDKTSHDYMNALKAITTKYGIEDRVKYLGEIPKEKLRPFYKKADVYVQTSLYETFGKTTIEALACGCPVIASNTSATPEILGGIGLLYDPLDSNQLCDCISKMLFDNKYRDSTISEGIIRSKMFSLTNEAQSYVNLFNELK
jgi:glycosyltransferase involved in cell wall biosynthesis